MVSVCLEKPTCPPPYLSEVIPTSSNPGFIDDGPFLSVSKAQLIAWCLAWLEWSCIHCITEYQVQVFAADWGILVASHLNTGTVNTLLLHRLPWCYVSVKLAHVTTKYWYPNGTTPTCRERVSQRMKASADSTVCRTSGDTVTLHSEAGQLKQKQKHCLT